jgi:outer membrane protein assembly factor BamB
VIVRTDDTVAGWSATAAGLTYLPKVHAQRLEAHRGERLLWAQQLGGRPAGAPVLAGGHVIQACRDGYVYAFDPATGKPQWRFLAARADLRLVNSGQIESLWPCVGAVLHGDTLAVAAGISPEMDGGGTVWGLDPETASIRWKIALVTNPIHGDGLDRGRVKYAGFHTNGWGYPVQAIKVVEDTIAIGYRRTANFGSHGRTFWAWVGVDPAKEQTVDLAARWRGTDRVWKVFDDGQLLPRTSELKENSHTVGR